MAYRIVLRGEEPSGRFLAVLCARTGGTIDSVKRALVSKDGLVLQEGLSRASAEDLAAELPEDGSVSIAIRREIDSWVAVLVGYRPGSRGRLRTALQRMSRSSTEEVIHFLASIPIALKSGIDRKTAQAVKELLEKEGGIVEVRPYRGILTDSQPSDESGNESENSADGDQTYRDEEPDGSEPLLKAPGVEPDIPPEIDSFGAAVAGEVDPPHKIAFISPSLRSVPAPPHVEHETRMLESSEVPYSFRFTLPWKPIPSPVDPNSDLNNAPGINMNFHIIPVYLHPVSRTDTGKVIEVLQGYLGFTPERCAEAINQAPTALCGFRERINALVALRELSEKGVPVSLVCSPEHRETANERSSFFGWLNGNR